MNPEVNATLSRIEATLDKFGEKLDKLDEKLDKQSERITKNEADINWIRGSIKYTVTILISVISIITGALVKYKSN